MYLDALGVTEDVLARVFEQFKAAEDGRVLARAVLDALRAFPDEPTEATA